jgi:hypothetical protein
MDDDTLKPLDSIFEPDPLSRIWARIDMSAGEIHPKTLSDHYADVAALRLPANVPEEIRRHFDIARTALLYSWFAWNLRPVAELYAYVTLELALRHEAVKEGAIKKNQRTRFKKLLTLALDLRWIRVEDLTEYKTVDANQKAALERWSRVFSSEPEFALNWAPQVDPSKYADMISKAMPFFRNILAHAVDEWHHNPGPVLARCKGLISQLSSAGESDTDPLLSNAK